MPKKQESVNREIYDFLTTLLRDKKVTPLEIAGGGSELVRVSPEESDVFKFQFDKDNNDYGDVRVSYDPDNRKLIIFYDDQIADSPDSNTSGTEFTDSWKGFRNNIKKWAMRKQIGFELSNKNHMGDYLQQRASIKKKSELQEGYYPMGKMGSYNDSIPNVKIVIQHTRKIEEGEQRFRNVAKIYVENANGERFAVPSNKPGIAKVYARHIAEGGSPYDERGRHITSLVEEYSKMSGFVRAVKNRQFNESTGKLVQEGINHYFSLRETLSKMTGSRGYNVYFESWTPILNEQSDEQTNINELFVHETIDPRIESVLPILSKLHKKVSEMNEIHQLGEWADTITETEVEEATDLKSIPEEDTIDEYEKNDSKYDMRTDEIKDAESYELQLGKSPNINESIGNNMSVENSELSRIMYLINPSGNGYKPYLNENSLIEQETTIDPDAPKDWMPTHFHKSNIGGDTELMMTKPGEFWFKSPNGIERFIPKGWDPIQSTRPGFDNRLSVDGRIVNGKQVPFKSGENWKDFSRDDAPAPIDSSRVKNAEPESGGPAKTTQDISEPAGLPPGAPPETTIKASTGLTEPVSNDDKDTKTATDKKVSDLDISKDQARFEELITKISSTLRQAVKPSTMAKTDTASTPEVSPKEKQVQAQDSDTQVQAQGQAAGKWVKDAATGTWNFVKDTAQAGKSALGGFLKGITTEDAELENLKRLIKH